MVTAPKRVRRAAQRLCKRLNAFAVPRRKSPVWLFPGRRQKGDNGDGVEPLNESLLAECTSYIVQERHETYEEIENDNYKNI